jgi:hypothetical protein
MRPSALVSRLSWLETADALASSGQAPEIERAIRHALARTARPSLVERARSRYRRARGRDPGHDPDRCRSAVLFQRNQTDAALAVLRSPRAAAGSRSGAVYSGPP